MRQQYSVSLALLLIIPLISAQLTQSPSNDSKLLEFVDKFKVNGCPIFVHNTGSPDGPHFAVEPLMCVTESLQGAIVRYDSFTKQIYVRVAVMVTDDAILAEVQRQLTHVSPKSVKFATVSDISVSANTSSVIQVLGFDWTPDEAVGFLRIGCSPYSCKLRHNVFGCRLPCLKNLTKLGRKSIQRNETELQNMNILLSAKIFSHGTFKTFPYRLTMQNQSTFDISMSSQRYLDPPTCKPLRFLRSIKINQCTARVHERLDLKGHFLIEPLLCRNITNTRYESESVMYDDTRDMHYLNLNVLLQDETTLNAVLSQLTDLSPVSVAFMRLWNAQSHVASALSGRFEIGGLMVSGDWRSGQVRVYCKSEDDCDSLRAEVYSEADALKHVKWILTVQIGHPAHRSHWCQTFFSKYIENGRTINYDSALSGNFLIYGFLPIQRPRGYYALESDGKLRVIIQQRKTPGVSFQRDWSKYEDGFGDDTDFWIGLTSIHLISINGVKLRVEMKLWNGAEKYAEYAGFKVFDSSVNYTMTYKEMLRNKSNVEFDALRYIKGRQFQTRETGYPNPCSNTYGKSGWWFNACTHANPNGILPSAESTGLQYVAWTIRDGDYQYLKEIKLALII